MYIGVVKEIKTEEYRVGLTPESASDYIKAGHKVRIECGAGEGSGFKDSDYENVGCLMVYNTYDIWQYSDMIIKVKEPQPEEYKYFRPGLIIYTFFHLAADYSLTKALLDKKVISVAYETITENGTLPVLKPMSEIAGRLAVQQGAKYLEKPQGGRGVLLGGVPGIERGEVVVLGGGVVGLNACRMAIGLGANVTVLDISLDRMAYIDDVFHNSITTLYSNESNLIRCLKKADLVVGAVLVAGAKAPHLIKEKQLYFMKKGSVIVDVAIDQGGCTEKSYPTTHENPVYDVFGVTHYCVANIPGCVPLSSTLALNNVTTKYGVIVASNEFMGDERIRSGINTYNGKLTNKGVADAHNLKYSKLR